MKSLITLMALSLSTATFACPEISGSYSCRSGSHVSEKNILKNDNGYLINSDGIEFTYFTDGNTYNVEANDSMKDGKVKSYCKDNKFIVDFKATILYEGAEIARQTSVTEYVPAGANLVITTKTKMKGLPMPLLKLNCTRL